MRSIPVLWLWMSALLLATFGGYAYAAESQFSFAVPLLCSTKEDKTTRCLAASFRPGLNVVLVNKSGICSAKTAEAFDESDSEVAQSRRTRLKGNDGCFSIRENEAGIAGAFSIGVVGQGPLRVRPARVSADDAALPREWEKRARKLAEQAVRGDEQEKPGKGRVAAALSPAKPKVVKAADVLLVLFDLQMDRMPWEPGPTVVVTQDGAFLLQGACTYGHLFFLVNDKLHLTYHGTVHCCACGDMNFFVYDLSEGSPALVYHNGEFTD